MKELYSLAVTVQWAADSGWQMIGYWQVSVWLMSCLFSVGSFPLLQLFNRHLPSLRTFFRLHFCCSLRHSRFQSHFTLWMSDSLTAWYLFELAYRSHNCKDAWKQLDAHRNTNTCTRPLPFVHMQDCMCMHANTQWAPVFWMLNVSLADKIASYCFLFPSHLSHRWV